MIRVGHETCVEYVKRRLSEGWKCVSLDGYKAILLSPEGIIRPIDLRHDVETLRPSGDGDEENIATSTSGVGNHWADVDDEVSDEETTNVQSHSASSAWERDIYLMEDSGVGADIINKVTLYGHYKTHGSSDQGSVKLVVKEGGTVGESVILMPTPGEWAYVNAEWAENPDTSAAWEWDEIDNLQIGHNLRQSKDDANPDYYQPMGSQLYAEIDYSPAAPGLENKSAGMAAKMIAGRGL
ncbi:hypothetical protein ES703_101235 [subsurface metagenome]